MKAINPAHVQAELDQLRGEPVYVHLETTNGAYASHREKGTLSAGAFIRNVQLTFEIGKIAGNGPYRIGLETDIGWLYAEGLTDWEKDEENRLLFAGHDHEGRLAAALELSRSPFPK
ncbi:YojF family protein [Alkalicoccus luteus]|uniref:YojF family protein n=1 Tax=Alkalicoccus luteus TaxID=1237094 RepID=UPI001FE250B1|nr:YojF family protein [Alkalicoccus luteus]